MKTFGLLFVAAVSFQANADNGNANVKACEMKISKLTAPDATGLYGQCGCSFGRNGDVEDVIFLGDAGDKEAWLNLNGTDTKFVRVADTKNLKSERTYRAGEVFLRAKFWHFQSCAPRKSDSCESENLRARFVLVGNQCSTQIDAVGACGC